MTTDAPTAAARVELSADRYRLLVESMRDYAVFMLDPDGIIVSWNLGAELIKGYTADEIIGKHFSIFYPPDALARSWPEHELKVARAEGRYQEESWRIRKDGTRFWANVTITAMRSPDGTLIGFSKITRDLTDRKRHEEALRQSEERLRLFTECVKDYAIFMLVAEGYIVSWYAGAQHI